MKINNLPTKYHRFVVARLVDNEFWFWGSFDTEDKAKEVSRRLGDNASVFDMDKVVV